MVRLIIVIDIELENMNWNKRVEAMKVCLTTLANKQALKGDFKLRKTHMKGFRAVFENLETLTKWIQFNEGSTSHNWDFMTHSESNYASIFFVNWPIELEEALPDSFL